MSASLGPILAGGLPGRLHIELRWCRDPGCRWPCHSHPDTSLRSGWSLHKHDLLHRWRGKQPRPFQSLTMRRPIWARPTARETSGLFIEHHQMLRHPGVRIAGFSLFVPMKISTAMVTFAITCEPSLATHLMFLVVVMSMSSVPDSLCRDRIYWGVPGRRIHVRPGSLPPIGASLRRKRKAESSKLQAPAKLQASSSKSGGWLLKFGISWSLDVGVGILLFMALVCRAALKLRFPR